MLQPAGTTEVQQGQVVSFSCAPGDGEPREAVAPGARQYIDLRQVPDAAVVPSAAPDPGARLRPAFAFVGFTGGLACCGTLIRGGTSGTSGAADAVGAAGMVGFFIIGIVVRLTRHR